LTLLALPVWLAVSVVPAEATTMAAADFRPGSTLGLGLAGCAYDYAWQQFDLGTTLTADLSQSVSFGHLVLGTRGLWRFLDRPEFVAALIGGVQLDPGQSGGRSYVVPDVGLGVAYRTSYNGVPLAFRLNLTVTVDQGQSLVVQPVATPITYNQGFVDVPAARPNLLQRLTLGPNANLGLGVAVGDRLELTLGGGTLAGLRYHY
jgi:hypothetical protein